MRLKFMIASAVERIRARNMRTEFRLLDLPNELVAHIIEFIDNINILRKLACTCHRLQHLAEPVLWRSILVREVARAQKILEAYETRRERSTALQVLIVPCNGNSRMSMAAVAGFLMKAPNLRELMVESPSCNKPLFETRAIWQPMMDQLFLPFQLAIGGVELSARPLQKLTNLTLHLNGPRSPYWTPDAGSLSIFLHPTLKYLRVSCVCLPEDLFNEVQERCVTPLQHLVLEECNITPEGLHGLLALPKALESLYLGENCHNEHQLPYSIADSYNLLFRTGAEATVQALRQQKHSLKSLTYAPAGITSPAQAIRHMKRPRQPGIDAGFADFDNLETIALVGLSTTFERAVMSSRPPPNLRSIVYQVENPVKLYPHSCLDEDETQRNIELLSWMPFLRAPSASVPTSFRNLTLTYQWSVNDELALDDEKKDDIRRIARALTKVHDANLIVTVKGYGRFYPPFLFGEPEPKDELIYDGKKDEFEDTFYFMSDSDEE